MWYVWWVWFNRARTHSDILSYENTHTETLAHTHTDWDPPRHTHPVNTPCRGCRVIRFINVCCFPSWIYDWLALSTRLSYSSEKKDSLILSKTFLVLNLCLCSIWLLSFIHAKRPMFTGIKRTHCQGLLLISHPKWQETMVIYNFSSHGLSFIAWYDSFDLIKLYSSVLVIIVVASVILLRSTFAVLYHRSDILYFRCEKLQ